MTRRALVATRKGLFRLTRESSGRWTAALIAFPGDPVSMVLPATDDRPLFAALNLGHFGTKLHRSGDDGATWEECAVPAYPKDPENPKSLSQIWCLEGGSVSGALWAGTIPGGLFRSGDGGNTWNLNRALWEAPERRDWFGGGYDDPGIHSVCVDPENPRRVAVAVSCGGVWFSENDGETWTLKTRGMFADYMPAAKREEPGIQDPHRLVQCRTDSRVLWVQHHNGIFRSADYGETWDDLGPAAAPSAFGFAVASHPRDPETAWFIPAVKDSRRIPVDGRFVVSRTRDGGRTFEILREGLPEGPAYDLVFRHGLDVDETGETLVLGSSTGSLWVSENGGETWKLVSPHLPPIYAVRFDR